MFLRLERGSRVKMEMIRLNKYLAECGICSRRDADKLISEGKVTVNGKPAVMGMKIQETDRVIVGKKVLGGKDKKVVLAYYKPIGVVCTERDKHAEKKVMEEIGFPIRITYAGRLDKESEGLLLLSNDGDLIQRIMRAKNRHEKEYVVKVKQEITDTFLEKMSEGVYLKELEIKTRPCYVEKTGKYTFKIILTQGVNRQIRRMCKELGTEVVSLKRIRVMNITLDGLKPGEYRMLYGEEKELLYQAAFSSENGADK